MKMIAAVAATMLVLAGCSSPTLSSPSASSTSAARRSYWGNKPDTAYSSLPTTDDTGQAINYYSYPSPSGVMYPAIKNGLLIGTQTSGQQAWYRWFQEPSPVTRLGVRLTFNNNGGALKTSKGVAGLALATTAPADYLSGSPKVGAHFVVGPTFWEFQILDFTIPASPVIDTLAQGDYPTPLVQDGKTVYGAEMFISGNSATLLLPGGGVYKVTDSSRHMSAWSTGYAFIEQSTTNGATDDAVGFVETWADTGTQSPPG